MLWLAVRKHRRAIIDFCKWAVGTMMAISLTFGVSYLPYLPLRALPAWGAVSLAYGLIMAAGLIVANGVLWAGVLLVRRWYPSATAGLVAQAIACCIGSDLGIVPAELTKAALTGMKAEISPLLTVLMATWWVGIAFFSLRVARDYAARYHRVKKATELAQGQVLASQLRPHFLFNALNSLAELIDTDAKQGAEMAQRLAELFRRIASSADHATMPLATELAIVRDYLEIEKVRLGARLSYEVEEPTWSSEHHVPTLMVQTLVENAIKHGIAPSIEGGTLKVTFGRREDDVCQCTVLNTGAPYRPSIPSKGVGLANTRHRLTQLYGDEFKLTIDAEKEGTRATFCFTGAALAQDLG
jgi:LytS/YehU family sensor histidine kinase